MKVILIDDEPLILERFEKLIKEIDGIEIAGKYINPHQALGAILQVKPDVVFLDIEMPELNGIELAEQIHSSLPQINIVFVTAYSEYAVKAFELNAIDYLVKPVQRERLVETIRRLPNNKYSSSKELSGSAMVLCFQSLQFKRSSDESQLINVRWRTSKARELFAFLVQYRQKPVRKDVILDLFWPEVDWDKGFTQLYTTIYQIRKTLDSISMNIKISSHENSYMLDLNGIKLDVDEWEKGVNTISTITNDTLPQHRKLLELYRGDYLAEFDYLWAESERERLRSLWLFHVTKVTEYLVSKGEYNEAIKLYHQVQESNPQSEDSYFMLMQLYREIGDRHAVEVQYKNLNEMLANEFAAKPKPDIQDWYRSWKEKERWE